MMGNHGVTGAGPDVASAFEESYLFVRACRTLMIAYSSGQPLNVLCDAVAAKVAKGWASCREMTYHHFGQLKLGLDRSEPDYGA